MTRRRLVTRGGAAVAVVVAVLAAAGCGSSTSTPKGPQLSGTPIRPGELASRLSHGLVATTSVHVDLSVDARDLHTHIAADEQLRAGRPTALRVDSDTLGLGGPVRIVAVGDSVFARGPRTVNPTRKPWVSVTSYSRSGELRRIAQAVDIAKASVSPTQVTALARAATAASRVGPARIGTISTTHYEISVDTAELPAGFPGKRLLDLLSLHAVPVDIHLDALGRPVGAALHVTLVGQQVALRIDTSRYGEVPAITAPPPDEVGRA